MDDLLTIIAELGLELHPDRIAVIATRIETIGSVEQFALVKSSFGPNADKHMVNRLGQAWQDAKGTSPRELASALRGAAASAALLEARGSVELVWTGPSTGQVPVRHTEQVLCEVIESAKRRLFLVSFVAYQIDSIIAALRNAVGRQVQIDLLVEPSSEHGGRVDHDSAAAIRKELPSANIYVWQPGARAVGGSLPGAVHAKCAVADDDLAFVTSANLTTAAMERNIELGVLVRGGHLPAELSRHLEALVSTKVVTAVKW